MKWKLGENSLFAILLRQGWWVSALAALVTFGVVQHFIEWGYALFATTPFTVITLIVAWKQIRTPSGTRVAKALEKTRGMSWEDFAQALERGYKAEGYAVQRVDGAVDFELEKLGRVTDGCDAAAGNGCRNPGTSCVEKTEDPVSAGSNCGRHLWTVLRVRGGAGCGAPPERAFGGFLSGLCSGARSTP